MLPMSQGGYEYPTWVMVHVDKVQFIAKRRKSVGRIGSDGRKTVGRVGTESRKSVGRK